MAITDVLVDPQLSVLFIDPCLTRQYIYTWPTACVQAEGGAAAAGPLAEPAAKPRRAVPKVN